MILVLLPFAAGAQDHGKDHSDGMVHGATDGAAPSPYAGLDRQTIASLSAEDVAQLHEGAGWGLALPAELNGTPGPAHLLELAEAIGLSPAQVEAIRAMHAGMRRDAVAAGARLIDAETRLDAGFRAGGLTDDRLRALIDAAEAARADLRYVHLSRHLSTVPLLTPAQRAAYARRRGYGTDGAPVP